MEGLSWSRLKVYSVSPASRVFGLLFKSFLLSDSPPCIKIGTRSVHVGSLSEVSKDTPNYNCTLLSIVTMLNTLNDRYFAGYAQTQANCNAMFDVCKRTFFEIGHANLDRYKKPPYKV